VRTSTNGIDIKQVCDTDPSTNMVRNMAAGLMNDLKEGHWIDFQTRLVDITIQLESANAGLEATVELVFEFPSAGGVVPSFMINTRRIEADSSMSSGLDFVTAYVVIFIIVEVLHFLHLRFKYFRRVWTYVDWANYIIFFISASLLSEGFIHKDPVASTTISETVGFVNRWETIKYFVEAKQLLAINATLQVLKIMKFCNVLVPRMSMLADVLMVAAMDLLFFGVTFGISLVAFADCFYVNLGSNIDTYYSFMRSIISLLRSLFGDFDIEEIDDNSPSTTNSYIFLAYLFFAVFIMLSMIFAILGEAQGQVIARQKLLKLEGGHSKRPLAERVASWVRPIVAYCPFANSALKKVSPVQSKDLNTDDATDSNLSPEEQMEEARRTSQEKAYKFLLKMGYMMSEPERHVIIKSKVVDVFLGGTRTKKKRKSKISMPPAKKRVS